MAGDLLTGFPSGLGLSPFQRKFPFPMSKSPVVSESSSSPHNRPRLKILAGPRESQRGRHTRRSRGSSTSFAFAPGVLAWIASAGMLGAEAPSKNPSPYVVLVTEGDGTVQAVFERYPELRGSWEELARFNLLRPGRPIEIPLEMLEFPGTLAKVASFYGEAEVKRSFDPRFIPLVPNLLLREGDEIRTWRGAGARILFDDGNYILLKSQSRATLVSLGTREQPATSRLQLFLKEGSIWSQMEHELRGRFEVKTPTANTIIRGTEFRVKVEPGEATRVEVLDGRVDFEMGERRLSVGRQEGALAVNGSDALANSPLPPAPELLAPLPEEVLRSESFDQVFLWGAVEGAEVYSFEIARDDRFFDLVAERRVGPEATVRIQGIEPGTYFWRVTSIVRGFESSPAESRYFVFVDRRP